MFDGQNDDKKRDLNHAARRNYAQLKFYGPDEFSTRMCALIHAGQYDNLNDVYDRTMACDKRPIKFPIDKTKLKQWLKEFSMQGMLVYGMDFKNNDKVTHETTKLYDMVLSLYTEDRGIHPIEQKKAKD